MNRFLFSFSAMFILLLISCRKETTTDTQIATDTTETAAPLADTVALTEATYTLPERPAFILADIDGDTKQDSVIIIKDATSEKEGLRIVFANTKVDTLGIVHDVAGQDFDDISWAGIFEKASKGDRYADNTDENGEFRDMDKVPDSEWVTLKADGIFLHAAESCGGGMIYLENGTYKWIQQE